MSDDQEQAELFDVAELAAPDAGELGPVEAGLRAALTAATKPGRGHLVEEDLGLVGSALAGARALDAAVRNVRRDPKGGYLVASLLTPYRETLAALRLPAAVAPLEDAPPPAPGGAEAANWEDVFGRPE